MGVGPSRAFGSYAQCNAKAPQLFNDTRVINFGKRQGNEMSQRVTLGVMSPTDRLAQISAREMAAQWGCRTRGAAFRRDRRGDAVAARHDAGQRRENPRPRLCDAERQGRGAGDQFARRLARAVAADLSANPATCRGEEAAGAGVRRGCRRVRRLHDRLRGRRDLLRSVIDPRIDRRGRRHLRISAN